MKLRKSAEEASSLVSASFQGQSNGLYTGWWTTRKVCHESHQWKCTENSLDFVWGSLKGIRPHCWCCWPVTWVLELNMQCVSAKFVPCLLTTEQKEHFIEVCQDHCQSSALISHPSCQGSSPLLWIGTSGTTLRWSTIGEPFDCSPKCTTVIFCSNWGRTCDKSDWICRTRKFVFISTLHPINESSLLVSFLSQIT